MRNSFVSFIFIIALAFTFFAATAFYPLAGSIGGQPETLQHASNLVPERLVILSLGVDVEAIPYDGAGFATYRPDAVNYLPELASHGSVGIIAHSNLVGENFYALRPGDQIIITFTGETTITYEVTAKLAYQSLGRGSYREIGSGMTFNWTEMTWHLFGPQSRLTLFTCMNFRGTIDYDPYAPLWGRMAVFAEPEN